jgi:propanediol utilization protein
MKEEIKEIIRTIQKEKRENKIVPYYALYVEISNRIGDMVKSTLNEMVKNKEIKFSKTLNDIAFYEDNKQN